MPKDDSDPTQSLKKALSRAPDPTDRVIRVDKAIECCEDSVSKMLSVVDELANLVISARDQDRTGLSLALVPAVVPGQVLPTVRFVKPSAATAAAGTLLLGGVSLSVILESIAAQDLAFTVLSLTSALRDVVRATKTKNNPCYDCMLRRALPQGKSRHRVTHTVYSRRA